MFRVSKKINGKIKIKKQMQKIKFIKSLKKLKNQKRGENKNEKSI